MRDHPITNTGQGVLEATEIHLHVYWTNFQLASLPFVKNKKPLKFGGRNTELILNTIVSRVLNGTTRALLKFALISGEGQNIIVIFNCAYVCQCNITTD